MPSPAPFSAFDGSKLRLGGSSRLQYSNGYLLEHHSDGQSKPV